MAKLMALDGTIYEGRKQDDYTAWRRFREYEDPGLKDKRLQKQRDKQNRLYQESVVFREERKANARKQNRKAVTEDRVSRGHLRRRYGLGQPDFETVWTHQEGKCLLCAMELTRKREGEGRLFACVDHCHDTQRIRGLLCNRCNGGLGMFLDNPALLRRAADYLDGPLDNEFGLTI